MKKAWLFLSLLFWTSISWAQLSPGDLSKGHSKWEGMKNCTQCHTIGEKISDQKCLDCHKEIKSLIDQDRGYHASKEVAQKTCVDCHSEHHGLNFDLDRFDQKKFNHNLSGFELEGAHVQVDCRDCHKPDLIESPEIKKLEGTFLGMGTTCLDCHEDYHQNTLDKNCAECHNPNEWEPADLFDHNEADFRLKGAHIEVDCKNCHQETTRNGKPFQQFSGIKFANCVDCHDDVHEGNFGNSCTDCHTESSWNRLKQGNKFDHNLTSFPLEGLHVQVDCKECHTSGNNTRNLKHQKCMDCHQDYHEGDFADQAPVPDCNSCHTLTEPFTYTTYGLDEHQNSSFPLMGSHEATPCFSCHISENKWEFADLGTSCVDCHENIHKEFISEKFYPSENCLSCHSENSWTEVKFDHSQTAYPLEKAHETVSCKSCHIQGDSFNSEYSNQKFAGLSQNCIDCHTNPHGTQFGPPESVDCKSCHTLLPGWDAGNFDHANTQFPLEGKHIEVDCASCHMPSQAPNQPEQILYKIQKFECRDCHS